MDRNSEDEEEEFEEEEDAQQSHSVAIPRRTSEEGFNMEKDLAKPLPSQKNMLQKSDKSSDGKAAVSKPLQSVPHKALPIQIPLPADGKDAQTRLLSAEGKDAQNRLSSVKKNVAKPKSNAVQLQKQARVLASNSTSKVLQSANRATANLKKAPEPIVAPSPMVAPGLNQAVANLQPKQSVAAAAKPKSIVAKRKPLEDLRIAQSKKAKPDEMFAKIFESIYNQDDLESVDDDTEPMKIDCMIAQAEKKFHHTPADLGENETINDKETEEIMQVVGYTATIAKAHKKSSVEAGKEPSSQSPIWSTEKGALQMLHGLQTMNIIVCDILASIAFYKKSDDAPIMQMLSIYISRLGNVPWSHNCAQSLTCISALFTNLEVMEKLIKKYVSSGSICKVFAEAFPIDNHPLLGGWVELEGVESSKKRGQKELDNLDESDGADGKYGAWLLLLLAYMMVSNVLDDESNNSQIRPAIQILGGKPEWKPVLRKLGQMLFLISPDQSIAEYEECYKICINQYHFLNTYLFINKAGGKKTPAQKRSPTAPKQLPDDHTYAYLDVSKMINSFIATILPSQ
ncbi:hypothetical protein G9A89_021692, partial [Geosiphon pyriformis]